MLPKLGRLDRRISPELIKSLALIASYGAWILLFRLFFLSFLVYFLTRQGHRASFQEINEAFAANEIPFVGLASGCFALLLRGFSPLIDRAGDLKISTRQLKTSYLPGFLRGLAIGSSVVAAFILFGSFRFVGFFVQIEDVPIAVLGIGVRIAALLALAYGDELVFRAIRPAGRSAEGDSAPAFPVVPIGLATLAYCVVKMAQFELSWMHFATLLLLSATLSVRRLSQESFLNGAGYCAALLIVFHPLFSLPIFGSDFSGIFLLKYQSLAAVPAWVSGGIGGPLSSVAFQAVLLIELVRGFLAQGSATRQKKALLKLSTSQ